MHQLETAHLLVADMPPLSETSSVDERIDIAVIESSDLVVINEGFSRVLCPHLYTGICVRASRPACNSAKSKTGVCGVPQTLKGAVVAPQLTSAPQVELQKEMMFFGFVATYAPSIKRTNDTLVSWAVSYLRFPG